MSTSPPEDNIWQAEEALAAIGATLTATIDIAAKTGNHRILRALVSLKSETNKRRGELRRLASEAKFPGQ